MLYIGVDPGKSGAIAVVDGGAHPQAHAWKTPDMKSIARVVHSLSHTARDVAVERVHSFPGQGVVSSFTFGMAYGSVLQAFVSIGFTILNVQPKAWMKHFSLPSVKDAGGITQKKNAHKALATKLFPSLTVTHATADALLIALWNYDTHS